ncbi:MAG: threonine/serine dehydratase [Gemmatimonadaceae bacterium]
MSFRDLGPEDIRDAARRMQPVIRRTELRRSDGLSDAAGGDVYIKLENHQETGSFKIRGAFNAIASLDHGARVRGVAAASAGNHGLGVARAAKHFGIPATIFVPRNAPAVKRNGIEAFGASVHADAEHYDDALARAQYYAREQGVTFINACLGDTLLAGQGTVALEILEQLPSVATVVLPVGGGGLLGGMAAFLRHTAPNVRILGAQSDATSAMARSLRAGRVVEIPDAPTLAEGLAGQIDDDALEIGRLGLDDIAVVSETELADAIAWLAHNESEVVEGSGAVAVAAILTRRLGEFPTPAVIVLSGGNIDKARHAKLVKDYLPK